MDDVPSPIPNVPSAAPAPVPVAPVPVMTPAVAATTSAPRRRARTWRALRVALWLALIAGGVYLYTRMTHYGERVVQAHPVDARIEITNPPAWLDRRIVNALLEESYQFASHDMETYNRSRDLLDAGILKEFANLYTGTVTANGKPVPSQTIGYNAWIRKITQIRRVSHSDEQQTIQITAEWRQPAAWVRVDQGAGPMLYLIDADGTRLPGEYRVSDRGQSPLMVLTGLDLPKNNGAAAVPAPGEKWFADGAVLGGDVLAGMQLMELLCKQKFAPQIAAIDMSNFNGRVDDHAPWIVLETIFPTAAGTPRVVQWGRSIGQEKYYEVQAPAKIKALKDVYARFNRIDANRDYVDIRSDVLRLPKVAVQPAPPVTPRG